MPFAMDIHIRQAQLSDIPAMHQVRMAVKENVLSDPGRISEADYRTYLTERGQGWVALLQDQLIGFAVVDVQERNVWALFVHPDHEGRGAGGMLHDAMLAWTFDQGLDHLWLSTDPDTRAAEFYRRRKWQATGTLPNGELRFEITAEAWRR